MAPVIPTTTLPNLHDFMGILLSSWSSNNTNMAFGVNSSEEHRTVRFKQGQINNDENIMKRAPNYRKETREGKFLLFCGKFPFYLSRDNLKSEVPQFHLLILLQLNCNGESVPSSNSCTGGEGREKGFVFMNDFRVKNITS